MDFGVPGREIFRENANIEECAPATVEKYQRGVRAFAAWLGDQELEAARVAGVPAKKGYAPFTINFMLSAVNRFLKFLGRGGLQDQVPARPA